MLLLYRRNKVLVNELRVPAPGSNDLSFPTKFPLNFFQQLWCILWKQNLTYWRSPDYNLVRGAFTFCTALICGSIFWGVGKKLCALHLLALTQVPQTENHLHLKVYVMLCFFLLPGIEICSNPSKFSVMNLVLMIYICG
jgi:hypothetical protein